MGYVRSIENETFVKDRHVIFSSFVTSCNTFLVVLTYRLLESPHHNQKQSMASQSNNMPAQSNSMATQSNSKLYIFVL